MSAKRYGLLILLLLSAVLPLRGETPTLPDAKPELWPPSNWADTPKAWPRNVELTLSDSPADRARNEAQIQADHQAAQLWKQAVERGPPHTAFLDLSGVLPGAATLPAASAGGFHLPQPWQDLPEALPRNVTWKHSPEWDAARERPAVGPWKQVAAIETWDDTGPTVSGINPAPVALDTANLNTLTFLDDRRFIIADGRHPIRVFDADTGQLLTSFGAPLPNGYDRRIIVHSDDGRLMMILPDTAPTIWDTRTGQAVATLPKFIDKYIAAAFIEHGRALAVCRGQPAHGRDHGNLQIWDLADHQLALRRRIDATPTARHLQANGPYLLLQGDTSHIYETARFKELLTLPETTNQHFLFLRSPTPDTPGAYVTIELSRRPDWRSHQPQFLAVTLPDGDNWIRWQCPVEENDANDHRFQARYTISPQHEVIALSQEGRVNFFQFISAKKLRTIPGENHFDHVTVNFLSERHALLANGSLGGHVSVYDISTGRELARIPDSDSCPETSPDGTYVALRRAEVPYEPNGYYRQLNPPLVILWKRTADYPAPIDPPPTH